MAKSKYKSKKTELFHKCPHCDLVVDFPVTWCIVGEHHMNVLETIDIRVSHPGICTHCFEGLSPKGRQWRRDQGAWAPHPFFMSSWDDPEWWDMLNEWKNTTVDVVWSSIGPDGESYDSFA